MLRHDEARSASLVRKKIKKLNNFGEVQNEFDKNFDYVSEEGEIQWKARFHSVRQLAFFTLIFFIIFLTVGTIFLSRIRTEWTLYDNLLFSVHYHICGIR